MQSKSWMADPAQPPDADKIRLVLERSPADHGPLARLALLLIAHRGGRLAETDLADFCHVAQLKLHQAGWILAYLVERGFLDRTANGWEWVGEAPFDRWQAHEQDRGDRYVAELWEKGLEG